MHFIKAQVASIIIVYKMLKILFENQYITLILGVASALWLVRRYSSSNQPCYINSTGQRMKGIKYNTRIRRFTHGRQTSDEGYEIASGEPYTMRNGNRTEVVLCAPEHLRDFYAGDAKTPDGNMGYFLHRLFGQCVGAQNGDEWAATRSLFDPIFSRLSTLDHMHLYSNEVHNWVNSIRNNATTKILDQQRFIATVPGIFAWLPLKLIAQTLYGEGMTVKNFAELVEIAHIREELSSYAFLSSEVISRLYAWLPTRANRLLTLYADKFQAFNLQIIETSRKQSLNCPLERVFAAVEGGSTVTMLQLMHTVDEILFENLDVASSALAYLLINVGGDAELQQKLREEVQEHTVQPNAEQYAAYMNSSESLLEYCCLENRRLCPALCFTFCERAPSDKVIGGYHVPSFTDVTVDWFRINLHASVWSATGSSGAATDGFSFNPTRFAELAKTDYRYSFVGYGAGVRKCLGQHFANLTMRIVLAAIVSRYSITSAGQPWDLGFREDKFVLTPEDQPVTFCSL